MEALLQEGGAVRVRVTKAEVAQARIVLAGLAGAEGSSAPRATASSEADGPVWLSVQLPHAPLTHDWLTAHPAPHAPQLRRSVRRFASQPLARFLSQSAKLPLQELMLQLPPLHPGVPLAAEHFLPQSL